MSEMRSGGSEPAGTAGDLVGERAEESVEGRAARFRAEAAARGLPADAVAEFIRLARPAVYLAQDGEGPVVARTGGYPLLPAGAAFPKACFVAAVDCAALPSGATDLPLPTEGHLLFFADPDPGSGAVLADAVRYVPAGTPLAERATGADIPDWYEPYGRSVLDFTFHQWCWPQWIDDEDDEEDDADDADEDHQGLPHAAELSAAWSHVVGWRPRWRLQLGGHPNFHNWDPVEAARDDHPLDGDQDEWTLLASWRADEDAEEHLDGGLFHWVIRRADLTAHRFDRVYVYVDMV